MIDPKYLPLRLIFILKNIICFLSNKLRVYWGNKYPDPPPHPSPAGAPHWLDSPKNRGLKSP